MKNSARAELPLQKGDIRKNCKLFIDPDNVFWALTLGKNLTEGAENRILSLYNNFKERLDASMRNFRFETNLNSVYVNPTDACNANCPYCYIPASKRTSGKEMSSAQLSYVLNKIDGYFSRQDKKPVGKPIVIYHASEPLLMKDIIFPSITKFNRKFHFGIQTNAMLLEKEDIKFLKSYKVSVGISLDSSLPKINNLTRRHSHGGNSDKAIRAIEWFNGYEGLNVISTITKHNVCHLAGLVQFLHSKKVPCVLLNPVRATRKTVVKLRPNQKILTKYFIEAAQKAMELSKKSRRGIIIGNFSNIILGIVAPQARRLMCDISPCGGGRHFFAVTPGGDMIPCGEFVGLKEFYGGNIFNSSIENAISSKPFQKIRRRAVENIAECGTCIYRNICGAPCPAEVYSLSKDLNTISPYCDFYKKIIKYAFGLVAEGKAKYFFRKEGIKDIKFEYKLNTWDH